MAQNKEDSFDAFLSFTPTIKELMEHVDVSTDWYIVGTMLDLDQKSLKNIERQTGHTDTHKMIEMFNLWLTTTPTASRRQILETLKKSVVGENTLADEYEKHLKEIHRATYTPPFCEAVSILQRNIQSLNEALVSPVQVSQLLYCKQCISEATLDKMEEIDKKTRSWDDKKTTLLTALQETVSSDYKKLKDIATVLSGIEEAKEIANGMMSEYESKIPQEGVCTVVQPQEVVDLGGNESCASNILRNNYSALSQSITEPVRVAEWLHEEVLSDEALSCVMSTRGSVLHSRAALLKAVRGAVRSNYKHLELFVTVLRKFSETAHIGDTIFEEYRKHFHMYYDDVEESEIYLTNKARQKSMSTSSESSSFDQKEADSYGNHQILFPRSMKKKFEDMRMKFGSTFFQVRRIFNNKESTLNIDEVKRLIIDWFPDLKFQISYKKTIGEVLNVLKRKCNIIDLRPLENLAFEFNIEEAELIFMSYKKEAKDFCKSVSVSLCLDEELQAVATPSRLLCETVVLVFNWDPDEYTLQDINDVLFELEPLHKCHIQIDKIGTGRSIVVTCYCPAEWTGSLIMTVLGKIDTLQWKGLKEFTVGNCTVWNNKTTQVVNENTEVKDLLVHINDLKASLRNRDKMIMVQHKELEDKILSLTKEMVEKEYMLIQYLKEKEDTKRELASLKELSEKRLQEIKQLKLNFEGDSEATDDSFDSSSTEDEIGEVEWSNNGVHLVNPSIDQCMEVLSKLDYEHEIMALSDSSSNSIQFLLPTIFERRTIKTLSIFSSSFTRDSILLFSPEISSNKSITTLQVSDDSISDNGVIALAQSLQRNKTLQCLYLRINPDITSNSAQSLANLLLANKTLSHLYLYDTNIDTDGVMTLTKSLMENNTLKELGLDDQHKEACFSLPYYKQLKNRIVFL